MAAPNRNTLWADIFVDELARGGLKAACIAPGSRSTPLTVAFARHPAITVYSLLDERGAAYFALGLALATGQPAALVCTSGTAAANFFPAIVEANSAQVPLLVLTTDRPHELRHSGANQTIDQVKLYGNHVRWFVDAALPETGDLALRSLRTLAQRAVAATIGLPPGPVHLNFPFRKPLEPTSQPGDLPEKLVDSARTDGQPYTRVQRGQLLPSHSQVDALAESLTAARRGLIICGPRCPGGDFPAAVTRLALATGYPVLADALSGLRFGPHVDALGEQLISGYDTFLAAAAATEWPPPELILRFGAMPVSMAVGRYLGVHAGGRHIQVSDTGVWQDDTHTTSDFLWANPAAACDSVGAQLGDVQPDGPWLARWRAADEAVRRAVDLARERDFFEGDILNEVVNSVPQNTHLFVGNSLIVRHLDQLVWHKNKNIRVYANRGASGIDGVTATALGVAAASGPLVLVTGDVSFYHDLNSLLALRRLGLAATIVVINNNGGGIFHRLPIANFDPPFTEMFLTPHGLNFAAAAELFGLDYVRVAGREAFRDAFSKPVITPAAKIIEVTTDSVHHEQVRRQIIAQVAGQMQNPGNPSLTNS
ncbi:MAG: 2-succinyl-5-enolpyruvyl-6-hydroxy-3-cyclohexene-1-carboxylic-acid synthase [Anaerolineae bacterium]